MGNGCDGFVAVRLDGREALCGQNGIVIVELDPMTFGRIGNAGLEIDRRPGIAQELILDDIEMDRLPGLAAKEFDEHQEDALGCFGGRWAGGQHLLCLRF
jgi:hypothetical protein